MSSPDTEVLVIGGGPAGLGAALGLGRQLIDTIVFNSGIYRNALVNHVHMVPTWDHRPPHEYRDAAQKEIVDKYHTINFVYAIIEKVEKTDEGFFKATDSNKREWIGKKLILATGVKDIYPNIPGYAECWIKGIFHCLFCHGYEDRGAASIGLLAVGDLENSAIAIRNARGARAFADIVTIYTNGVELTGTDYANLTETYLRVDTRPIKQLIKGSKGAEVIMEFSVGESKTEGFLMHSPRTEQSSTFAADLSLELDQYRNINVSQPFNESSMQGVYAVGDCGSPIKFFSMGAAMGGMAAAGAYSQLR